MTAETGVEVLLQQTPFLTLVPDFRVQRMSAGDATAAGPADQPANAPGRSAPSSARRPSSTDRSRQPIQCSPF